MRLSKPWPDGFTINPNGKYGMRKHPITGRQTKHRGLDVAGTFPVTSAAPGVVTHIGWSPKGGGHTVVIDHGEVHTAYYHGAHKTGLRVGQRVEAGTFIYTSGTTGASTGVHLHFEVRRGPRGAWGTDVDPTPYLNGNAAVSTLKVSGREDRATWKQWQTWLQAQKFYQGRIDGVAGPMTYRAIQAWVGTPQTGKLDLPTRKAVQERIGVTPDGVWGRSTWSTLQRKLNEGSL
jgi:murein DD-endopeptidase MepM/ murein hydrolase activator NlpD